MSLPRGIFKCDEFIQQHNHICYCEAIIYPNGDIEYAVPSHQKKLINIYQKVYGFSSEEEAWNSISVYEYSLPWICNKVKCVSVWYNNVIIPSHITKKQIETLLKLNDCKIISIQENELLDF